MDNKEFILNLYKKGYTLKHVANLIYIQTKKRNNFATKIQALNLVESIILEFYTTQRT